MYLEEHREENFVPIEKWEEPFYLNPKSKRRIFFWEPVKQVSVDYTRSEQSGVRTLTVAILSCKYVH